MRSNLNSRRYSQRLKTYQLNGTPNPIGVEARTFSWFNPYGVGHLKTGANFFSAGFTGGYLSLSPAGLEEAIEKANSLMRTIWKAFLDTMS